MSTIFFRAQSALVLFCLSLTTTIALADEPVAAPAPKPHKAEVEVNAAYSQGTDGHSGGQGGEGGVDIRLPFNPSLDKLRPPIDLTVSLGGGYVGGVVLGHGSFGIAPAHLSKSTDLLASVGMDCNLVACSAGTYIGARLVLGNGQTLDLQGKVPQIGGWYINRATGDVTSTLGGIRLGFNKNYDGMAKLSAYLATDLTNNTDKNAGRRQDGIGELFEVGFEGDAPITENLAFTVNVAGQDQRFKHVEQGATSCKQEVGVKGNVGLRALF